jgi:hypothetical protein
MKSHQLKKSNTDLDPVIDKFVLKLLKLPEEELSSMFVRLEYVMQALRNAAPDDPQERLKVNLTFANEQELELFRELVRDICNVSGFEVPEMLVKG